jgi:hypothetical protein
MLSLLRRRAVGGPYGLLAVFLLSSGSVPGGPAAGRLDLVACRHYPTICATNVPNATASAIARLVPTLRRGDAGAEELGSARHAGKNDVIRCPIAQQVHDLADTRYCPPAVVDRAL